jgi:hypothetical protein
VLPGASITVRNSGTGAAIELISDERGRYLAPLLQPGEYEIQVSLQGFQSVSRRGIRLAVGQSAVIDIKLEVGQVTSAVDVVAASTRGDSGAHGWKRCGRRPDAQDFH